MSNKAQLIRIEHHVNSAIISLERPQKAHAYTKEMLGQLLTHLQNMPSNTQVVVIQSTGHRAFCAGADLNELQNAAPISALHLLSQRIFDDIAQAPFVSIAAVHGPAVAGGCELALACDLRVAGPLASFSLPEVSLGLIPSAGGCSRLPKLIGSTRAKAVILGQHTIHATEALNWGLINCIVDDPHQHALQWAEKIAQLDPDALRMAKQIIDSPSLAQERVSEALLYAKRQSAKSRLKPE